MWQHSNQYQRCTHKNYPEFSVGDVVIINGSPGTVDNVCMFVSIPGVFLSGGKFKILRCCPIMSNGDLHFETSGMNGVETVESPNHNFRFERYLYIYGRDVNLNIVRTEVGWPVTQV